MLVESILEIAKKLMNFWVRAYIDEKSRQYKTWFKNVYSN